MIIALAGRRIDAEGAPPAFPLERVGDVRDALRARLDALGATALVCSAACGADLVALELARTSGRRFRIILPFDRATFRDTSVVDRPGDWGPVYDEVCDAAAQAGDLVVLGEQPGTDEAYLAANERILNEALMLAGSRRAAGVHALAVWNGPRARGADATRSFLDAASRRGIGSSELRTLNV